MPLQSQVIRICVPQKRCFSALFLENPFFDPLRPNQPPPHDIHQRKAVHLSFLHVPQD